MIFKTEMCIRDRVDVVGVRPKGHTSFGAPVGRQIVASAANGLPGLPVITINCISGTKMCIRDRREVGGCKFFRNVIVVAVANLSSQIDPAPDDVRPCLLRESDEVAVADIIF